jgi:hypothetical protein
MKYTIVHQESYRSHDQVNQSDDMVRMSLTCSKRDWVKFMAWAKKENELIILPCPVPWCKGLPRSMACEEVWIECSDCECQGPCFDESDPDAYEKSVRAWNAGR